jgi:hypothetical protein
MRKLFLSPEDIMFTSGTQVHLRGYLQVDGKKRSNVVQIH